MQISVYCVPYSPANERRIYGGFVVEKIIIAKLQNKEEESTKDTERSHCKVY